MKQKPIRVVATAIIMIVGMLLSSCGPTATPPTATPVTPTATLTGTATLLPATATEIPTLETPLGTSEMTSTGSPITPTDQITPSFSTIGDTAALVTDVSIPDYTVIAPGATFTKTWRLSNTGSTTWTTNYSIVYTSGTLTGNVASVPLAVEVPAGKTIDVSVPFTAPSTTGQYNSFWMLKNSAGQLFGLGPNADQPFFMVINVGTAASGTATNETATPGSSGNSGNLVTAASLTTDQTTFSGSCPVTINLNATITINGSGSFTYQLEAGSTTSGFVFSLPAAQTSSYSSGGSHTMIIAYTLDISSTVTGWVKLSVSSPNTLQSNQVDLSITCQ